MEEGRIERAIAIMEQNLTNTFTAQDAAHAACYSYFHFHRLFTALVGISPGDYIRRRRLTEAAGRLCGTKESVTSVALEFGYESGESFGKAFRTEFGCSPSAVRKACVSLPCFLPRARIIFSKDRTMEPKLIQVPAFTVLGYQTVTSKDQDQNFDDLPLFWENVTSNHCAMMKAIPSVVNRDVSYGICTYATEESFFYTIGHEVASDAIVPDGMTVLRLPASRYAVFTVPPGAWPQMIHETWEGLWRWFDTSDLVVENTGEIERYEVAEDGSSLCSIWMPVKEKQ